MVNHSGSVKKISQQHKVRLGVRFLSVWFSI